MFQEALVISREMRDSRGVAVALHGLGVVASRRGDGSAAQALLEEALALNRRRNMRGYEAGNLTGLATVALNRGDVPKARALLAQALEIQHEIGERRGIAEALRLFARLASLKPQAGHAARLFGTAEALQEATGAPIPPSQRADYDRAIASVRAAMDEEAFITAWSEGRAMSLEQAVHYALEDDALD
jgi:tetratricopeptide (TPR) repeat protein